MSRRNRRARRPPVEKIVIQVGRPLTVEDLERAFMACRENYGRIEPEVHSPKCPKFLTQGAKACCCSTCPEEAAFEDELERKKKE